MSVLYDGWRQSLRDGQLRLSAGFYRHTRSGLPIAIWPAPASSKDLLYRVDNGEVGYVDAGWEERVFSYAEPVTEKDWREASKTRIWKDFRRIGDNRPPEGVEAIRAEIENLTEKANDLIKAGPAQDEETANQAANIRAYLDDLHKQLTAAMEAETAPHHAELAVIEARKRPIYELIKTINDRFKPAMALALDTSQGLIRKVIQPYLIDKRHRASESGQVQTLRGGGTKPIAANVGPTGAKVKLVTRWWGEVVDYDAAIVALKDNPKIKAVVQDIADAAARSSAKIPIPGIEFRKKEEAR